MKNKILTSIMAVFILFSMVNISAEMWYWTDVNLDYDEQIVTLHGFYNFEDTSSKGIGRNKPIEIEIDYLVQALPYNFTGDYSGQVDWCNFTTTHLENEYGTEFVAFEGFVGGDYINTTTTTNSYYFENTSLSSAELYFELKDRDSLILDMDCHYTNVSSLYADNVLFGRWDTYFGAYKCDDCEEYSLEELSNEVENNEQAIGEQTQIYDSIQNVIAMNYNLWLIISWLVKIAFIILAVTFIFSGVYYIYNFLKDIEEQI